MEGGSQGEGAPAGAAVDAGEEPQEPAEVAAVTELQKAKPELQEELRKARDDYNIATGTISSLQRHLEIQEAQLRRINSEKETLQRKLRERENELRAMSAKFCSLREDRAQGEMIVTMEKENCSLRQVVTELESKLAEQKEQIAELQGTVSHLRAEVRSGQQHICTQQQTQEVLQRQAEALQHRMLQTSVALESITSKFERYRNKIIQNTFSAAGSKAPQAEVSDEEVLEAMQKIINERTEFYQLLRQRGIRVPSPFGINRSASPTSAKGKRKSPARGLLTTEK